MRFSPGVPAQDPRCDGSANRCGDAKVGMVGRERGALVDAPNQGWIGGEEVGGPEAWWIPQPDTGDDFRDCPGAGGYMRRRVQMRCHAVSGNDGIFLTSC